MKAGALSNTEVCEKFHRPRRRLIHYLELILITVVGPRPSEDESGKEGEAGNPCWVVDAV